MSHSEYIREPIAEFFGVLILITLGAGVDCSVVLTTNPKVSPTPKGVSTTALHRNAPLADRDLSFVK